jgi:hypothetical protein
VLITLAVTYTSFGSSFRLAAHCDIRDLFLFVRQEPVYVLKCGFELVRMRAEDDYVPVIDEMIEPKRWVLGIPRSRFAKAVIVTLRLPPKASFSCFVVYNGASFIWFGLVQTPSGVEVRAMPRIAFAATIRNNGQVSSAHFFCCGQRSPLVERTPIIGTCATS